MENTKSLTVIDNVYLYRLIYEVIFMLPLMAFIVFLLLQDLIKVIFGNEQMIAINYWIVIILFISWIVSVFKRYRGFNKNPPKFIFENSSIIFESFKEDADYRKRIEKDIKSVVRVSYLIIANNRDRHGFVEHKSFLKKTFKTDIGDLFIEIFMHGFNIVYWLGIGLPSRTIRFLIKKEPLQLIWKNLLIEFEDEEAFIININSLQELLAIKDILQLNKKKISTIPWFTVIMHEDKKFSVSTYKL